MCLNALAKSSAPPHSRRIASPISEIFDFFCTRRSLAIVSSSVSFFRGFDSDSRGILLLLKRFSHRLFRPFFGDVWDV